VKILIVDDAPISLKLLRNVLEAERFEVAEAQDGVEALAVLKREAVDAIISDILMPGMDGYRLCREVRQNERWRNLPFIFHTATYNSPADEKLCYDLGADQYLQKPASAKNLLAALTDAGRAAATRPPDRPSLPSEAYVMREYNERLVSKLEEKNMELEQARLELESANRDLDRRVQLRTSELEAANRELESFAYSVSHDLRAPLRHVRGYIDIVLQNSAGRLDEVNLQHLQHVRGAAGKMGELIDGLLELSRVSRAELNHRVVDLSTIAAEICVELAHGDPGRKAAVDIEPGLRASGDHRLLRIVLSNLLSNAWKYSRKKPDARIEFGKLSRNGPETFFVRDNGAGFDMAYVGKLFGAFQRLHAEEEFEGIGVGLATVKRIIQRHNGSVRAESVLGQGATFYFSLGGNSC
jgi:two-component system, sensor histidine kinase and response regulator